MISARAGPKERNGGGIAGAEPTVGAGTKAPAGANRSAGAFASALLTAFSTAGDTWRTVLMCGMGSVKRLAMMACAVGPVYGGSPASISYNTLARLYWSLRPSSLGSALACSGLM